MPLGWNTTLLLSESGSSIVGVSFLVPNQAKIQIQVEPKSEESLSNLRQVDEFTRSHKGDYTKSGSGEITLGGEPALYLETSYVDELGGTPQLVKNQVFFTRHISNDYTIEYTSLLEFYDQYHLVFDIFLKTFRFSNKTSS